MGKAGVTSSAPVWYPRRRMQAAHRPSFQPVEAGAVLAATMGICAGIGALVGWAAGSIGLGVLGGVVVGIPAGVFVVYRRFRGYFT
jgi:F0F1-type ATP synthase assembly protein I